ncbi:MAG: oxidoreductase coenzyme F420-dependent [Actinomycetia bacterium]|nr:oxidoreductase coenzyme F420-dependent [Actinomycetes bacterium]
MARLAVDAGYDVVLSNSRGPGTLADLVAELGPRARAASGAEAAAIGDLVLVSIPLRGYPSLPAPSFVGKIVLDTGNYYPERDGRIEALDSGSLTDSEHLAQHLPGARVVKVFNNIFFKHLQNLARPAGAGSSGTGDRTYLPIAGDDAGAKLSVVEFLDSIGYGADDGGPLADGWRQQPGTPVYGAPYGEFENEKGAAADAAVIRAALAAATRM